MTAFSYAALDSDGAEQKGVVEADSSRQVRQILRDKGLAPLNIRELVPSSNRSQASGWRYSLSVADLSLITRQLATLVQSGMPLEEALHTVSRQSEKPKVGAILLAVRSRVLEGYSLADSMAEFPKAFPSLYRATVAAGEHSGFLAQVLVRLADYTEASHAARQKVQLALLYPALLLIMAVLIVSGLMVFVVPDVVEVFVVQGQSLPLLTQTLMTLSDWVVSYGLYALFILFAVIFFWRLRLRNPEKRRKWHENYLRWPLIRRISRGVNTARFASTLSILTGSGVPLVDAMRIAGDVLSNDWLRHSVKDATQQLSEGSSLHKSLEVCRYFPPMMIHMIASGEASGDLDNMLARVAENQQREQDHLINAVLSILEPAMLVIMGVCVLLIVIAILQPIFALNQLV